MNETGAMAEMDSREFRVRYSKWMHGAFIVCFFVFIAFALIPIIFLVGMRREMTVGTPPVEIILPTDLWLKLVLMLLGYALFYLLVALGIGYREIRNLLEQKRSRVVVDEQNLSLTDWRGRERVIPLSDIQELREVYWGAAKPSHLAIKVRGKWSNLSQGMEKKDEAAEIIIARGGLTNEREGWYATRYWREG